MFYHEIKYDIDYSQSNLLWNAWGSRDHGFFHTERLPQVFDLLAREFGLKSAEELPATPSVAFDDLKVPESRLSDQAFQALQGIVGKDAASRDRTDRVFHSRGQSYHDLLRLRTNALKNYVDAVVWPSSEKQIEKILEWCGKQKVALVPYGGGSSVVGGVEALAGKHKQVLSLDLTRLDQLIELDEHSRLASFEAGIYGPRLEKILNDRGFTLGHFPQSFEYSTLGGWAAARSAGQQSSRYGKIEAMLTRLRVLTPAGPVETMRIPASATGPDMNQIMAGSEGLLGVISRATVRVHPLPEGRQYMGVIFPDFVSAVRFVEEAAQEHDLSMCRLSDPEETRLFEMLAQATRSPGALRKLKAAVQSLVLRAAGQGEGRCLVIAGMDGGMREVQGKEILVRRLIHKHGGFYAGEKPGLNWLKGRFNMPFLRNHLMERGVGVDTLETSTTYDRISEVHRETLGAIRLALPKSLAMAHISHSYHEGASLYFTVLFPMDTANPVQQWQKMKTAASDALLAHGGAISHHHGIGVDHRAHFQKQVGKTQLAALRALKAELDPHGLLNPGKLFD